jgi:hypothetical protein
VLWTALKVVVALIAAVGIYYVTARMIHMFTIVPPEEPEPGEIKPVHFSYRCIVCGSEATITAAPGGEMPEAPRHCREDMVLVADANSN